MLGPAAQSESSRDCPSASPVTCSARAHDRGRGAICQGSKLSEPRYFRILVNARDGGSDFVFIEANARLQVEHTVTEAVTGVDLVQSQIRVACGESLADLDLADPVKPRGYAIQARVNLETLSADGSVLPSSGTLTAYEPPSGPGVRVDGFGYNGYQTSTAFDSLLAKVIVSTNADNFAAACAKAGRALTEFRIEGLSANTDFLQNILSHADFIGGIDPHSLGG